MSIEKTENLLEKKMTRRKFISNTAKALAGIAVGAMIPGVKSAISADKIKNSEKSPQVKNIEDLKALIPAEHLEIYKNKIFPKIFNHLKDIHEKLGKEEYDIDLKNLYHAHLYFKGEIDNPRAGRKLIERENDITYLYHAKELMKDETKRNIFIDNKGRFETYDGDKGHLEGREIAAVYFADSLEEFEKIINYRKDFIDRNSLSQHKNIYFAVSNMNYR